MKYHKACPVEQERRKHGSSVLTGVRNQLASGSSVAEVLLCLGTALDDAIISSEIEAGSQVDEDLFETNFAERLAHSLESEFQSELSSKQFENHGDVEIFSVTHADYSDVHICGLDIFRGAVIDTGAAKSCIGAIQARAYSKWAKKPFKLRMSSNSFKLGDVVHPSLGELGVSLPTSSGSLAIDMDVISADTPMLLGVDFLDKHDI